MAHSMVHGKEKKQRLMVHSIYGSPTWTQENSHVDLISAERPMVKEAKIVVGIDFGTSFSGFAYASVDEPDKVFTFYEWPSSGEAGAKPYCKTQTSVWYLPNGKGDYKLEDWGWSASVNHAKAVQKRVQADNSTKRYKGQPVSAHGDMFVGHFVTNFKRQVAASGLITDSGLTSSQLSILSILPPGLPVEVLISEYLKQLSILIMTELETRFSRDVLKREVQWCLTVPAIWTQRAKQTMKQCLQMAGLVQGPYCRDKAASLHEEIIVSEPEAASVYCQQQFKEKLRKGTKFLVVDAGGGTVDLVVHEKVESFGLSFKEVTRSTGDFCGGTFVDEAFMDYLAQKIDCFQKFSEEFPSTVLTIKGYWENFKYSFDGRQEYYELELPGKLRDAWEANQKENGSWTGNSSYCDLTIFQKDMKKIFNGQVDKILKLIQDQLQQVPTIEAIMVVGGFSNSPYLMRRIRDRFGTSVNHILSPTRPGSAVCQGAVTFGLMGPDLMKSRKSRKTYGVDATRNWFKGDPKESKVVDDYDKACLQNWFLVFIRIGDEVPVNHKVSQEFHPVGKGAKKITFTMYSTTDPYPAFVTDRGVSAEGSWVYPLPLEAQEMDDKPEIEVTMYFGRTLIEVFAEPKNFEGEKRSMLSVSFERE